MRRRLTATAGLTLATAFLAAGCGSSGSSGPASQVQPTTPTSSATSATANANGCSTPPPLRKSPQHYGSEPKLTIAKTTYTATIVTNCGTIVLALDGKSAPHTVNSFAFLASKGFFDDTPCHRLTTAGAGIEVLQCGDPTGSGSGGPGYTIPDENLKGATYPTGTVAMANTGQPHTGGSQFFLVYGPTQLQPQYTPFGHIVSGLDVLRRIAKAGTDGSSGYPFDGRPNQPVVIESFTVKKG
ncbi:MAG: peptidylprolyl isomerase [Mycobacteriales bacterium]